jgi:hypothetical protein
MNRISKQTRIAVLLLGMFIFSFALYAGAESGSTAAMTVLLGALATFMVATILNG